ncbi:hypothetical protein ABL840_29650 [Variovorax sp. NFACC27]|uniref:hypothetical protein n=1 Tax=unclassified Variovorax TaxID=663243 RepID=UPI000B88FB51
MVLLQRACSTFRAAIRGLDQTFPSDELWGINWKQPGQVIAFHHHMEGAYEVVGTNIADVYRTDFTQFKDRLASN